MTLPNPLNPPCPPPNPSSAQQLSPPTTPTTPPTTSTSPHLDSRCTLRFEPITRDIRDNDTPLCIGSFTDRSGIGLVAVNTQDTNKLPFESKVVSHAHAEIWADNGKSFIKDTKSSSRTFLNHLRLSLVGSESEPHQLKDGVRLGVDYQGGTEGVYKSVKIMIEVGRE